MDIIDSGRYLYLLLFYTHLLQKLIDDLQGMEPSLKQLCEDVSVLLIDTDPDEEPTKLLENTLASEKKHQDTLESAKNINDMLKSG